MSFDRISPRALCLALTLVLLTTAQRASAASLTIDLLTGKLLGATGVDVNGRLYDITFVEGSCIEIFSGCTSAVNFDLMPADAQSAIAALLDQVFRDTPQGNFDSQPELTFGCDVNPLEWCLAWIPTALGGPMNSIVSGAGAQNGRVSDTASGALILNATSSAEFPQLVIARFTPATEQTPEQTPEPPASLILLGMGGVTLLTKLGKHWRARLQAVDESS